MRSPLVSHGDKKRAFLCLQKQQIRRLGREREGHNISSVTWNGKMYFMRIDPDYSVVCLNPQGKDMKNQIFVKFKSSFESTLLKGWNNKEPWLSKILDDPFF